MHFLGPDHPVGVICSPELIQGLTGKIDPRDGGLKRTCPARGLNQVWRRRHVGSLIFIRPLGALVPASATIYEFEIRPRRRSRGGPQRRFDRACPSRVVVDAY